MFLYKKILMELFGRAEKSPRRWNLQHMAHFYSSKKVDVRGYNEGNLINSMLHCCLVVRDEVQVELISGENWVERWWKILWEGRDKKVSNFQKLFKLFTISNPFSNPQNPSTLFHISYNAIDNKQKRFAFPFPIPEGNFICCQFRPRFPLKGIYQRKI